MSNLITPAGDLFDATEWQPASSVMGMTVKLDRNVDRENPCCENVAVICAGKPPHAAAF